MTCAAPAGGQLADDLGQPPVLLLMVLRHGSHGHHMPPSTPDLPARAGGLARFRGGGEEQITPDRPPPRRVCPRPPLPRLYAPRALPHAYVHHRRLLPVPRRSGTSAPTSRQTISAAGQRRVLAGVGLQIMAVPKVWRWTSAAQPRPCRGSVTEARTQIRGQSVCSTGLWRQAQATPRAPGRCPATAWSEPVSRIRIPRGGCGG